MTRKNGYLILSDSCFEGDVWKLVRCYTMTLLSRAEHIYFGQHEEICSGIVNKHIKPAS
jgi:hypothetical protein